MKTGTVKSLHWRSRNLGLFKNRWNLDSCNGKKDVLEESDAMNKVSEADLSTI